MVATVEQEPDAEDLRDTHSRQKGSAEGGREEDGAAQTAQGRAK